MKTLLIITGIVLIFLAFGSYTVPILDNGMSLSQGMDLCNSNVGQLGKALSQEALQKCNNLNSFVFPIGSLALLGIILFIVGVVKK